MSKEHSAKKAGATFAELPQKEFLKIYAAMEINAERHYRCAKILASNDEYQNAIAHLILGSEELIKAFVSLLNGKGFKIKQLSWFAKLFKDHRTRHTLVKDFFSIWLVIKGFLELGNIKGGKGFWSTLLAATGHLTYGGLLATVNYRWWQNADKLKQDCFYVGFEEFLVDPISIVREDYNAALMHTGNFKNDVIELMRKIENSSPSQLKEWEERLMIAQFDKLIKETVSFQSSKVDREVAKNR